jgi:hypothetical protein
MNTDHTAEIASQWETGLRMDSARLKQLNRDFALTMRSAQDLGLEQKFSEEWNTTWMQRWKLVDVLLVRITGLVNAMDESITSTQSDRLHVARNAWESIHLEGLQLVESMSVIRAQTSALSPAARTEWNLLSKALDAHLENLNACSLALRVKLEHLMEHPQSESTLQTTFPPENEAVAQNHLSDLDAAAIELDKEHHQAGGFLDVVKGLFLWVESPEERVKGDQSV